MLRNSYFTLTKLRIVPDYTTWLLFPAIIGLGVILRLRQYLVNRSLWLDEALITLNIIKRGTQKDKFQTVGSAVYLYEFPE